MTKQNLRTRLTIVGINLILLALLFGLVSLNKGFFRPTFNHIPFVKFLTGIFPNFIAAYLISLSIVNAILIRKPKFGRIIVYTGSLVIFIILTIEEIKPMWGASTYNDLYDIFASGIGSALAILTFELISLRQKKKRIN